MTDEQQAVIEYRDEETNLVFRWHGGAYIEVGGYVGRYAHTAEQLDYFARGELLGSEFRADDVINVWDDEADQSYPEQHYFARARVNGDWYARRPLRYILEAFEVACQRYVAESLAEADAES